MRNISDNRLKIGLVLHDAPKYSETFFISKVAGLAAAGYDVFLFASNKSKLSIEGCKIVNPPKRFSNDLLNLIVLFFLLLKLLIVKPNTLRKFFQFEKREGASFSLILKKIHINSHILAYNLDWLHFGFATCAISKENVAKATSAKMAISFRGYDINVYPVKYPKVYNAIWSKVDKVHSISNSLYKKALLQGLSAEVPYSKITPAIDTSFFSVDKNNSCKSKTKILTIGRLTWIKGLDYSIQAMKMLSDRGVDFTYTIAGDGVLFERLKYLVHILNLEDKVFLPGAMTKKELLVQLSDADIYLQPSLEEGFCNSVLEAQACKCLCIGSDVGGLKENILDGKTGWLVPKRSPIDIADKVNEVLSMDYNDKEEIVNYAAQRVASEFSLEKQNQEFIEFYT